MNQFPNIRFETANLKKTFGRKTIFSGINFSLHNSDSLSITGKNGSGKSTMIKILSNTLSHSSGEINLHINNSHIQQNDYYKHIGLVSPYLNFYDEFSAYEILEITARIRGIKNESIDSCLQEVGLFDFKKDLVRIFSSGMKQRLKLAFALLHNPVILLLDEPTTNLDSEGIEIFSQIALKQKENGILIIATNDKHEQSLCEKEINLKIS
ncbi:MAG: ABC transporter ATP-binding protein [Ignavibacteria bacterium]